MSGCQNGYQSLPKESAPERFSIQTGIICSFFGTTSPLCKWVDRVLPTLPVPDEVKNAGAQIAKHIRDSLGVRFKATPPDSDNMAGKVPLGDLFRQAKQALALIEDSANAIQGGEIPTLAFCLAGVPPVPQNINWGDLFLAYSGLYPDFFYEKMAKIFAYEKYFEYCECRNEYRIPQPLNPDEIPDFPDIAPMGECGGFFREKLLSINENNNRARSATLQSLVQEGVDQIWQIMRAESEPDRYPESYISWEFRRPDAWSQLEENQQIVTYGWETDYPRLRGGRPILCCPFRTKSATFQTGCISHVVFTFTNQYGVQERDWIDQLWYFDVSVSWITSVEFEDTCKQPQKSPVDFTEIIPAEPALNPYDDPEFGDAFADYCPPCPECPECPPCPDCPENPECPPCPDCPENPECPPCADCPENPEECPPCPDCPENPECPPCADCPPACEEELIPVPVYYPQTGLTVFETRVLLSDPSQTEEDE